MSEAMDKDAILKRVVEVIAQVVEEDQEVELQEDVTLETSLLMLGINSLNIVRFIVELEDEFDIEFDDEMLKKGKFQSVEDLALFTVQLVMDSREG